MWKFDNYIKHNADKLIIPFEAEPAQVGNNSSNNFYSLLLFLPTKVIILY